MTHIPDEEPYKLVPIDEWENLNGGFIELENIISEALKLLDQMPKPSLMSFNYQYRNDMTAWKDKMRRTLLKEDWEEINEKW